MALLECCFVAIIMLLITLIILLAKLMWQPTCNSQQVHITPETNYHQSKGPKSTEPDIPSPCTHWPTFPADHYQWQDPNLYGELHIQRCYYMVPGGDHVHLSEVCSTIKNHRELKAYPICQHCFKNRRSDADGAKKGR